MIAFTVSRISLASTELPLFSTRLIFSDLSMSILAALSIALLPTRLLRGISVFFCCLLIAGNTEHIQANEGNLSVMMIDFASNRTFIEGSVLTATILLRTVLYFLVFQALPRFQTCRQRPQKTMFSNLAVPFLATFPLLFLLIALSPVSSEKLLWQQMNPIEENLLLLYQSAKRTPAYFKNHGIPLALKPFFLKDLSGSPIISLNDNRKQNILILIVESLSDEAVQAGWMPHTRSLQDKGIYFEQFIINSTTTNNGLYALFCGDFPQIFFSSFYNIAHTVTRKTDLNQWRCLPNILWSQGYSSRFIEAVTLSYAQKATLLEKAGFSEMTGSEVFEARDLRAWGNGATDESLYNYIYEEMISLREPWILATLNVGTHPPSEFTDQSRFPEISNQGERAFRVIDAEIYNLYSKMKARGLLDNTVVIITSDETRTQAALKNKYGNLYSKNHGFLLILPPGGKATRNSSPFLQSDLKLSLLDYLGIETDNTFGRSLFRSYTNSRRHYFFGANPLGMFYISLGDQGILHCNRSFECQKQKTTHGNIFREKRLALRELFPSPLAASLIAYSDDRINNE